MKLLFLYTNNSSQCCAILEHGTIPDWVEKIDLFTKADLAMQYGVKGVPLWVATDDSYGMIAKSDCINVDAVLQWYEALKNDRP